MALAGPSSRKETEHRACRFGHVPCEPGKAGAGRERCAEGGGKNIALPKHRAFAIGYGGRQGQRPQNAVQKAIGKPLFFKMELSGREQNGCGCANSRQSRKRNPALSAECQTGARGQADASRNAAPIGAAASSESIKPHRHPKSLCGCNYEMIRLVAT